MRHQHDEVGYKREGKTITHVQNLTKEVLSTSSSTIKSPSLSLGIQNGEGRFLKERSFAKNDML